MSTPISGNSTIIDTDIATSPPLMTFTKFVELPPELQFEIWDHAISQSAGVPARAFFLSPSTCTTLISDRDNAPLPALTQACYDSLVLFSTRYSIFRPSEIWPAPRVPRDMSRYPRTCINPATDSVLLHDWFCADAIEAARETHGEHIRGVEIIAIAPEYMPQDKELARGEDGRSAFWTAVARAFPALRKVVIVAWEGTRPLGRAYWPVVTGEMFREQMLWFGRAADDYAVEVRDFGAKTGVEFEVKEFVDDADQRMGAFRLV